MYTDKAINMDVLTDEEVDRLYCERKMNSIKTLAPLFIYLILKEHTSPSRRLNQQEILDYLSEYPYELELERKALGRYIHLLANSDLGIYSLPPYGTWMDQKQSA